MVGGVPRAAAGVALKNNAPTKNKNKQIHKNIQPLEVERVFFTFFPIV